MASYTENINALTSQTPYRQQLPVEQMREVGQIKQAQYNEGVQKIQSYIDNVAGLDVSKDIHKQYLQSKLNELGGKLKTVAAGDFSNFQLVNNVMGMTNQIVKDPVIQNAVYSTQVIRKGQQDLEAAKQSGKSSPQNEAFWSKQIADWQNDGDLNTRFNGSYISYTDVGKKLRDVADKIHEIDSSIDIPFQRDSAGNVKYGDDGKPLVDDAMLRIKTKGKPAEKILANFMSSLDENDEQQLHIDSWYHYRGVTKDSFKNDIISNYANQKKLTQDQIVNLNLEIQTNPKLTDAEKAQKQAQVNTLNKQLNSGYFEQSMQQEIASIDNVQDLEAYKYKVYTQKYLTNLAKDMSYQSYQQEITSNPYAQMNMERLNLQARYDQMAQQQRQWAASFGFEQQKWMVEQQQKAQKEFEAKYTPTMPGVLSTNADVPTLNKLGNSIEGVKSQITDLNSKYAPLITDPSLKTAQEKTAYLDKLAQQASQDPSFITRQSNDVRRYLEQRREYDLDLSRKSALFESARNAGAQYSGELQAILKNSPAIPTPDGRRLSNNDIFEVQNALNNASTTEGLVGAHGKVVNYERFISNYPIGSDKRDIVEALIKSHNGETLNSYQKTIVSQTNALIKNYNEKATELLGKQLSAESNYLLAHSPERQTIGGTIQDKTSLARARGLINDKIINLSQHGDINEGWDAATVAKMEKDKNVAFHIEKNTDNNSGTLYVTLEGKVQKIPLTSTELSTYFPDVARQNPMNDIIQMATFSPNKTTNLFGGKSDANAVNAYLSGYSPLVPQLNNTSYSNTVRFDVEADPFNNGGANDLFQLRMYVHDGDKWVSGVLNDKGYTSATGLQNILSQVGTKTVEDFLKKYKK